MAMSSVGGNEPVPCCYLGQRKVSRRFATWKVSSTEGLQCIAISGRLPKWVAIRIFTRYRAAEQALVFQTVRAPWQQASLVYILPMRVVKQQSL